MDKINNTVIISRCKNYDAENLNSALQQIFDGVGGIEKIIQKGKKIVIKPNLVLPKASDEEKIAITNSKLLKTLINLLLTICNPKDITIAESPGGPYTKSFLSRAYKLSNVTEVAEQTGVNLNFDTTAKKISKVIQGRPISFSVLTPVAESDCIINLNRLKTHSLCMMTAAVKNFFGCIPGTEKFEFHARYPKKEDFADMLIDLCYSVISSTPTLNITDAVSVMEGNGPTGGTKRNIGILLGSVNPYALDTVNCNILGYKENEVSTVEKALERGYSQPLGKIEIKGESPSDFAIKDLITPDTKGLIKNMDKYSKLIDMFLYTRPEITKKCAKCGACVTNCPKKIIKKTDKNKYVITDRKSCIKCFCCQELCPSDAIRTKKSLILKILN